MKILIAIHASHSQPEQMRAQRETWLQDLDGADYKFFLGQPEGYEPDAVYCDFPDGPKYKDSKCIFRTRVLNQKTEALAHYALIHGYDYVFKCDDDTYIRPDLLLNSGFEQHDYSGFTEPHYAFGFGHYRWAQGGAGYWLSRRAMRIVDEHGLHLVPAEDFAVGQLLARNGIQPFHDERYTPTAEPKRADWITMHKVGTARKRELYGEHRSHESRRFEVHEVAPMYCVPVESTTHACPDCKQQCACEGSDPQIWCVHCMPESFDESGEQESGSVG